MTLAFAASPGASRIAAIKTRRSHFRRHHILSATVVIIAAMSATS